MQVSTDLLRLVPLFRGMTDRSFEAIANLATETTFGAGDVLIRQGDLGHEFIIIVSGRAQVERDGKHVGDLGPGDFLGEISLVDGSPRTATVTALDPIDALCVHRDGFVDLIDRLPVFRLEVMNALTQRIRANAGDPLG